MNCKNGEVRDKILRYIIDSQKERGVIPSYEEICEGVGLKSKSSVAVYIKELEEMGEITKYGHRGIRVNKSMSVPIVGSIACGLPAYAEESIEELEGIIKTELKGGAYYILRARGDSMVGAGIHNGDLVIIRRQNTAIDGQIVVALIEDEATLKRMKVDKEKNKIMLHAENPAYGDMEFDNVQIQGVAVKVLSDVK